MPQLVLLALAAGVGSALLSGVLTPGSVLGAMLVLIAPVPLLIVGIGWHPLMAALGALAACLMLSLVPTPGGLPGSRFAFAYGLMVGLPSWLLAEATHRLAPAMRSSGPRAVGLLLVGAAGYAALVPLIGALYVDTSYDAYKRKIETVIAALFRAISGAGENTPLTTPDGRSMDGLVSIYAAAMAPLSAAVLIVMLALSLWIGGRVARLSDRLPFPWPDLAMTRLPRATLPVLALSMLAGSLPGWTGLTAELIASTLGALMLLMGLAVVHARSRGRSGRGLLLGVVWTTLLIFGVPGIILIFIGIADLVFDLRRNVQPLPPKT